MGKWAKPNGHWEWVEDDGEENISLSDMELLNRPPHETGDHWGPWVYDATHKEIECQGYPIALSRIDSTDELADWLAQLIEKTWVTAEILGQLVLAIEDIKGLRSLGTP